MADIPTPTVPVNALSEWYELSQQIKKLQAKKALLAKTVTQQMFPDDQEGTRKQDLGGGYELRGEQEFEYKVDWQSMQEDAVTLAVKHDIPIEELIRFEAKLNKNVYKALNEGQKNIIDHYLTVKPGSVKLSIKEKPKGD